MTLLFMDGFDTQDTTTKWVVTTSLGGSPTPTWSASTRFGTGYCVSMPVTNANYYYQLQAVITASAHVFLGAAVKTGIASGQNYSPPFHMLLGDSGATCHLYLVASTLGSLQLWRGDGRTIATSGAPYTAYGPNGTMLASTANGVIDAGWHYIELGATIDSSTGTATVCMDGATVLTFTGNTRNGGTLVNIDTIMQASAGFLDVHDLVNVGIGSIIMDDLYIANSAGSVNNTLLGDVRVQTLAPTGAGSSTGLTPTGSSSNYANVNEVPDSTATYNASSVSGTRDTYAMADLVSTSASVFGVQQTSVMFKSDAGAATMKAAQKSGATVSYGATRTLSTSPMLYRDMFEINPATSAAYTTSEVNALEAGAEVV